MGEHGEPDGGGLGSGPVDAVAAVGGEEDGVAGDEIDWLGDVFDAEAGGTGEDEDPLVLVLIIPEVFRRSLAVGDDAFDPNVTAPELADFGELLLGEVLGKIVEEVDEGAWSVVWSFGRH